MREHQRRLPQQSAIPPDLFLRRIHHLAYQEPPPVVEPLHRRRLDPGLGGIPSQQQLDGFSCIIQPAQRIESGRNDIADVPRIDARRIQPSSRHQRTQADALRPAQDF